MPFTDDAGTYTDYLLDDVTSVAITIGQPGILAVNIERMMSFVNSICSLIILSKKLFV